MKLHLTGLLLLLLIVIQPLQAQKITQIRAELDKIKRSVTLTYNLTAKSKEQEKQVFDVQVYMSLDSGLTYSDALEYVSQDNKKVKPGINYQILWKYHFETPDFQSNKIVFKLVGKLNLEEEQNRLLSLGTSSKVWQSVLLPGWGSSQVSGKKQKWWLGAGAYALVGGGVFMKISADNQYKEYQTVQSAELARQALEKAQSNQNISRILFATGAGIWIGDILYTLIRGSQNEKKQNEIRLKAAQPDISFKWQGLGAGLHFKF
jgi:hypothetical protein